jgi:hypothetical protein
MRTTIITKEQLDKAKENKYASVSGNDYVTPKSKFLAGPNQFQNTIGNLGEIVFEEEILIKNGIKYRKDKVYEDRGDYFDFTIIDGSSREFIIDVKTARLKGDIVGVPKSYKFFIAEHQSGKVPDFYVHIQLSSSFKKAYIMGFIKGKVAMHFPVTKTDNMLCPARAIPFSRLIEIDNFLKLLGPNNKEVTTKCQIC